jgi:hypothetical protein
MYRDRISVGRNWLFIVLLTSVVGCFQVDMAAVTSAGRDRMASIELRRDGVTMGMLPKERWPQLLALLEKSNRVHDIGMAGEVWAEKGELLLTTDDGRALRITLTKRPSMSRHVCRLEELVGWQEPLVGGYYACREVAEWWDSVSPGTTP